MCVESFLAVKIVKRKKGSIQIEANLVHLWYRQRHLLFLFKIIKIIHGIVSILVREVSMNDEFKMISYLGNKVS